MFSPEEISAIVAPLASAKTLPPQAYTSEKVFDAELKSVFYKEWVCVAREEQIPQPGDYRSVDVVHQPLIIVRKEDGAIHAMSAICPHRAMQVVDDHGHASSFSCPYHRWKFALNGALISAPLMDKVDNFPPADCGLAPVKVEVWDGFVFVNLDPSAQPLAAKLEKLNEIVAGYRMKDMMIVGSLEFECPWNWKLLVENFMEAYHHIGPHLASVQPTHNAKESYISGSIDEGWSVVHMPEVADRVEEPGLPPIQGLSETQKVETLASLIMPTFAWLNTPSVAFWYELRPSAYNQLTLQIHTLLPKEIALSPDGGEIAKMVEASIAHIHSEDISVNAGPWKGLQSPLAVQGPLSSLEESIWQMNQWWLKRVADKLD